MVLLSIVAFSLFLNLPLEMSFLPPPLIDLMFLLLMALPPLLILVRFLLVTPVIVLEASATREAIKRSWNLTRGSFWRIVTINLPTIVLVYLISELAVQVISWLLTLYTDLWNNLDALQTINTVVRQIGLIAALPIQLGVYTLLYYDLRMRKEGYDLELQAQQLALS